MLLIYTEVTPKPCLGSAFQAYGAPKPSEGTPKQRLSGAIDSCLRVCVLAIIGIFKVLGVSFCASGVVLWVDPVL